jgi:hypothetical protein
VTEEFHLIVTDASPLITLAAADALDCLTLPGLPVIIPDMVYDEVTRDLAHLGASGIVKWVRERHGQVVIAPTEVFGEFQALRTLQPTIRSHGRGDEAALEVLDAEVAANPDLQALLLFEDTDVRRRRFMTTLPERVMTISTGELLAELERAGHIQSSDQILDCAAERGRNVERQRLITGNEETRERLRRQLQRRRDVPEVDG